MNDRPELSPNILIDLDSVFDTRLPVIYAINAGIAESVLSDDGYRKRVKDVFGPIPYSVFSNYYNRRNKNVLSIAAPTPMMSLLKSYCVEAVGSVITESISTPPKLVLNTYPYDLNEEETTVLLRFLHKKIALRMDIEVIYKSNTELTPKYISNNIGTFIKYDIIDWLEYHNSTGGLAGTPLLSVNCIGPMLANGNKPTKELTQDDFDGVRSVFAPNTNLLLLQTRLFSLV